MVERTFAIIKPDAVRGKNVGKIIDRIEQEGFIILGMKRVYMSKSEAEGFYAVHKDRPFFNDLTDFISSGPAIVLCLEKESAIKSWRDLMGATDPKDAEMNTLRKLFGKSIDNNATHGSDAQDTAKQEIDYFFSSTELRS